MPTEPRSLPLFLLGHLCAGVAAGWALLAGLLLADVAGLRGLIAASAEPSLALGLLLFAFAVSFGGLAAGTGLASTDLASPGSPPRALPREQRPLAVRACPPAR